MFLDISIIFDVTWITRSTFKLIPNKLNLVQNKEWSWPSYITPHGLFNFPQMSDVQAGGGTAFPNIGLYVKPEKVHVHCRAYCSTLCYFGLHKNSSFDLPKLCRRSMKTIICWFACTYPSIIASGLRLLSTKPSWIAKTLGSTLIRHSSDV